MAMKSRFLVVALSLSLAALYLTSFAAAADDALCQSVKCKYEYKVNGIRISQPDYKIISFDNNLMKIGNPTTVNTVKFYASPSIIRDFWFDCKLTNIGPNGKTTQMRIPDNARWDRKTEPTFDCDKYKLCVYLSTNTTKVSKSSLDKKSKCEYSE